jgi:Family of unknown function (DUF6328)
MATKKLDLEKVVTHILEECRMVLPGIQALFGFQLIAVFNQRFETLPFINQVAHLIATGLVAVSAGLVMTPAAYHRTVEPEQVSERLVRISTRLVLVSMFLLAIGVSTDFFVISSLIFSDSRLPFTLASILFAILVLLWFVFPRSQRDRGSASHRSDPDATEDVC